MANKPPNFGRLGDAVPLKDDAYGGFERFYGDLDLSGTGIKSLGTLKEIHYRVADNEIDEIGNLLLSDEVEDLGMLDTMDGYLHIRKGSRLRSLNNLSRCQGIFFENSASVQLLEVKKELSDFEKVPKIDYPLHINHKNLIIRNIVNHYLETL